MPFVFCGSIVLSLAATMGHVVALGQTPTGSALLETARAIHDRVLVLDSHVDINPSDFTAERNYAGELEIQVDLPKMERGGVDAAFFAVYTRQGDLSPGGYASAYAAAIEKFEAIHRLTSEYAPDRIELALTADDVRRIHTDGRKAALIGVENAYPIGTDLRRIQELYDRGARYVALAHNGHNQFADSNTGEEDGDWMYGGLSPLGIEALREINRRGMMVDISHLSRDAMMEAVARSEAPVIASHSAIRSLVDHRRNLDDGQLFAVRDNGGVIQVVAYPEFVKTREPPSVQDFVDHIDFAVGLIGIDHVGIASDFNNGEAVDGWLDAGETLNVTVELVRRGYTEDEIAKLWGLNLLRVMDEAHRIGGVLRGE